jgi:hypothetical protein
LQGLHEVSGCHGSTVESHEIVEYDLVELHCSVDDYDFILERLDRDIGVKLTQHIVIIGKVFETFCFL